jgi:MFS transporter, DHA3 family, macrolide efflux protein
MAWGMIQEFSLAHMVERVMVIYTAIATATLMASMTVFGWMTETFNESISVTGIGFVLFLLTPVAAWFSRRVTGAGDPTDVTEREASSMVRTFTET